MAKLTFTLEDGQEIVVQLNHLVTLGSAEGNDVVVDDPEISGRHAEVRRLGDEIYEVIDLNSACGTFVNGDRVSSRQLANNDKVMFGRLAGVFHLGATSTKSANHPGVASDTEAADLAKIQAEVSVAAVEFERLSNEKIGLTTDVAELRDQAKQERDQLESLRAASAKADVIKSELDKQLSDLNARLADSQDKLRHAEAELQAKMELLSQLRSEEKNLQHVTVELRDAESKHNQWLEAIRGLGEQYDLKAAEVQRLTSAAENALRDLESMHAHKAEALAHLQSLREERTSFEESLPSLRQQSVELEKRCREAQLLAEAKEDQIVRAEKNFAALNIRLGSLEARVAELSATSAQLEKLREECSKEEARHGELLANIGELEQTREKETINLSVLENTLASLKQEISQHRAATEETIAARKREEELSREIISQREACELECAAASKRLSSVQQDLEATALKHSELKRMCEELEDTEAKLVTSKADLASLETRRREIDGIVRELDAQRTSQKTLLDDLIEKEQETKNYLEKLVLRESDLNKVLERLSHDERERRERFGEMQKLASDAEREHAAQVQSMKLSMEETRRELAEMEVKLAPMREWKEAMEKRYARLASLPEDSAEARALWREIENERSGPRNVVSCESKRAPAVHAEQSSEPKVEPSVTPAPGNKNPTLGQGRLHAPPSLIDEFSTPEERGNVGQTGTGALISGTGQEMALKARINRLRESVQREALRLEFLRQERAREETRGKGGSPGDAMMREHERQLENKIRREEEHFATLQRKMETSGIEEEKRRDKIAEMERKITELRADIADAERKRGDARHQADLTQAELKNYEAALDRVKKLVEV